MRMASRIFRVIPDGCASFFLYRCDFNLLMPENFIKMEPIITFPSPRMYIYMHKNLRGRDRISGFCRKIRFMEIRRIDFIRQSSLAARQRSDVRFISSSSWYLAWRDSNLQLGSFGFSFGRCFEHYLRSSPRAENVPGLLLMICTRDKWSGDLRGMRCSSKCNSIGSLQLT